MMYTPARDSGELVRSRQLQRASAVTMAPKVKLTYFNYRGAAEPIRYLLAYADRDYQDVRVPDEEWLRVKASFPFGRLPVIEVDGKIVNQSTSICRYLAKQSGLAGNDEWESLQIDALADTLVDVRNVCSDFYWCTSADQKAEKKDKILNEVLPMYLMRFEATVKENNGFFVNGKLSYVDIVFAAMSQYFCDVLDTDIFAGYPLLKALIEKVEDNPRIKTWISKRPKTVF